MINTAPWGFPSNEGKCVPAVRDSQLKCSSRCFLVVSAGIVRQNRQNGWNRWIPSYQRQRVSGGKGFGVLTPQRRSGIQRHIVPGSF